MPPRHLVAAIVAVLVVTTPTVVWLRSHQETLAEQAVTAFAEVSESAGLVVEGFLVDQISREQVVAEQLLSDEVSPEATAQAMGVARSTFSMVLDDEGAILGIAPERTSLAVGDVIGDRYSHMAAALEGDVGVWSSSSTTQPSGSIVAIAVPFRTPSGLRVFSAAFPLADTPVLGQIEAALHSIGATAKYAIFNGSGDVISTTSPADALRPESSLLGPRATVADLERLRSSADPVRLSIDGTLYLGSSVPIGGTDWRLAVTASEPAVLATFGAGSSTPGLVLTIAIALLTAVATVSLLRVLDRMRNARRMAHRIEVQARETRSILEQSPVALLITREGRVHEANQAFENLTGWALADIRGRHLPDVLMPDDASDEDRLDVEELYRSLRSGHPGSITLEIVTRSGERITIRSHVRPIFDEHGTPIGGIHQITDITDLREREEEIRNRLADADRLARDTAHDLRTPVTTMLGLTELLTDDISAIDSETMSEILERISNAGAGLVEMIDEQISPDHPSGLVDLAETAQWIRTTLGGAVGVAVDGPERYAGVDQRTLRKIVINLVTNSVKYARPGVPPEVRLGCRSVGDQVEISVTDNGRGIDPSQWEAVFERGLQLDTTSTGTGLGLSMVRHLAESHGGSAWIEPAPSPGTRVVVRLAQRSTSPMTGSSDAMVATVSAMSESDIMMGRA